MAALMASSQHTRRSSRSSASHPAYRVEKPKSNNNSPRVSERRKTTSGAKRYATLDDHFNMMFGIADQEEEANKKPSSRPMSWHPSSNQQSGRHPALSLQTRASGYSRYSTHGSDFHSLSACSPLPAQSQDFVSYSPSYTTHRGSQASDFSYRANAMVSE
jgi:hypothetical protein